MYPGSFEVEAEKKTSGTTRPKAREPEEPLALVGRWPRRGDAAERRAHAGTRKKVHGISPPSDDEQEEVDGLRVVVLVREVTLEVVVDEELLDEGPPVARVDGPVPGRRDATAAARGRAASSPPRSMRQPPVMRKVGDGDAPEQEGPDEPLGEHRRARPRAGETQPTPSRPGAAAMSSA